MSRSPYKVQDDQALMTEIWDPQIADNPLNFVLFAFPWGKENTPLHNKQGPRAWQREELEAIADHIKNNRLLMDMGLAPKVYQSATASGRGVGKSAVVSWIDLWAMSCILGCTVINTANTETQLKTRTWAELGVWHTLSINSHWFEKNAMSLKPMEWFDQALKRQLKIDTGYYYAQAQLWDEENPDAFAGIHNQNGIVVSYDEASGIPENIHRVTEGFFTEPILHRYWFQFSNPRRNTGAFFECFHKQRKYWRRRNLDSRSVEGTDKNVLNQIIEKYGESSDTAKIEVKGQFPSQGDKQFISRELVDGAIHRELFTDNHAPLMMGVDPARFGDDETVIRFRQGRDARSIPPIKMAKKDNMEVANTVAHLIEKYNPDAVCIDGGSGAGVIVRLKEMKYKVYEIQFGSSAEDSQWANKRTELWARMREWLKGGCISATETDLHDDLVIPEYRFKGASDSTMLEPKEESKKRGFSSPDDADALALTFAVKVARRDLNTHREMRRSTIAKNVNYSIFGRR